MKHYLIVCIALSCGAVAADPAPQTLAEAHAEIARLEAENADLQARFDRLLTATTNIIVRARSYGLWLPLPGESAPPAPSVASSPLVFSSRGLRETQRIGETSFVAWRIDVSNRTERIISVSMGLKLLDRDGFVLYEDAVTDFSLNPRASRRLSQSVIIPSANYRAVTTIEPDVISAK